ncbi:tRNA lysidine(34) synthetase TilS [Candidatus Cyanaurora vandensis]|uniref:tRNA lysidine(34) synthetase TilS n=1 Tax=Candidatus Cyanaurora vandensis TaxID=2714958 RepID=UPI00257D90C1|nr:tRNA lysidine(34) synthetase TilS [Candidatus Cyanaurora vandensis]
MYHTPFLALHGAVLQEIVQRRLLNQGQCLLLAISGGQDSLCLGQLLVDLQRRGDWQLTVAHLDHRWRTDSDQAAQTVAAVAASWGLPFHLIVAETPPPTEASARAWRYSRLARLAQDLSATAVLTGHTATDRAETVLFNLMRGAGLSGTGSLDWRRTLVPGLDLVRPLLTVSREQTAAFCQARDLPVTPDPTNEDVSFSRNRLRQVVLPYLRDHFNPQVSRHLAQAAEIAGAEDDYLTLISLEHFARFYRAEPPSLNAQLDQLPVALQRRVVRHFLQTCQSSGDFSQVEQVRALVGQAEGTRTASLHRGQGVVVRRGWLVWL